MFSVRDEHSRHLVLTAGFYFAAVPPDVRKVFDLPQTLAKTLGCAHN